MKPVQIFVIVAVIIFIIWLAAPFLLLFFFFSETNKAGEFGDLFGSVNALFTGLAFAGLVCTIMIQQDELNTTQKQLKESSDAQTKSALALAAQLQQDKSNRQIDFVFKQFDIMNEGQMINARISIYNGSYYEGNNDQKLLKKETKQLLNYLNAIGYLLANDHLPRYTTLEMIYVQVIRVWEILGEYIFSQRELRGVYLIHLEWLASECFKYWLTKHKESKITIPTKNTEIKQRPIEMCDETKAYLASIENTSKQRSDQLLS